MTLQNQFITDLDQVKRTALSRATKDDSARIEDLSALVDTCKRASEAQKAETERAQIEKTTRAEAMRFWIPIAASFISAGVLAATLILQIFQFKESTNAQTAALKQQTETLKAQIAANEDTHWREAIKIMASEPTLVNSEAGIAFLEYFVGSERHGQEARDLGTALLGNMVNLDGFTALFTAVIRQDNKNDLPRLLRINRALNNMYNVTYLKSQKFEEVKTKSKQKEARYTFVSVPDPSGRPVPTQVDDAIDQASSMLTDISAELTITTNMLARMIDGTGMARGVDMSDCYFYEGDLSGVNFSGTNLTRTGFWGVKVDHADFSDVRVDVLGQWDHTAWWRAKKMADILVKDLLFKYPFPKGANAYLGFSMSEYQKDVRRLEGR